MFWEVFLKKILAILGKVLIFRVFTLKVFSKFFSRNREHGVYGGFWAFFLFRLPFPWFPIRVSIRLRLASDDSPFVLRSIFDRSSIPERRMNEGWTKDERESIEERSRTDREPNENLTRTERRANGGWYRKYTVTNVQNKNAKRVLTKKLMKQLMGINGN